MGEPKPARSCRSGLDASRPWDERVGKAVGAAQGVALECVSGFVQNGPNDSHSAHVPEQSQRFGIDGTDGYPLPLETLSTRLFQPGFFLMNTHGVRSVSGQADC